MEMPSLPPAACTALHPRGSRELPVGSSSTSQYCAGAVHSFHLLPGPYVHRDLFIIPAGPPDKCFPEFSSKCPFAEPAPIRPSCTTGQSSSLCQKNYNSAPQKEETELLISWQVCRALPGRMLPLVDAAHFWMEGECLHHSGPSTTCTTLMRDLTRGHTRHAQAGKGHKREG